MDSRSVGNCGSINVLGMGDPIGLLSYPKVWRATSAPGARRPALRKRERQRRPSPWATALDGQPGYELLRTGALVVPRVDELHRPIHEIEDRDVGGRPHLQSAQAWNAIDDLRRLPRRARHDVLQRNAHVQEFGHDVRQNGVAGTIDAEPVEIA